MKKLIILITLLSINIFAKNVLILNSYSPTSKWTSEQSNAIIETLKSDTSINIYVEFMNTKAFKPNVNIEKNLLSFFLHKYKNLKIDVVIVTDDNAINFIIKNQNNNMFKDSKVFFSGVNNIKLAKTLPKNKFAGIFEEKNPIANLSLAKQINKNLKTIYLIGDNTITSEKIIDEYKSKYNFKSHLNYIYIDVTNIEDVTHALKNYEKDSVLMLMVFAAFKKDNKHINTLRALEYITKAYKNPILTHDSIYTDLKNTNIIGGSSINGALSGKIVAKDVLKYFQGEKIQNIKFKFTEGINLYLNEKNLNKFGINIEDLDLETPIIVNKNNSFYKLYSTEINTFLVFLIVIMISIYIVIRNKQYKALDKLNKEIKDLNDNLEYKVSVQVKEIKKSTELFETIFNTVKNGVAILDLNSKFLLVNDAYEKITGFSKEEFYKFTCVELTIPKLRYEFKKIINEMPDKKFIYGYKKQYKRKDGTSIDIMMDLTLMPDQKSILVVAKDITKEVKHKLEQKQKDEQIMQQSRLAQMGEMISMIAHQWRQPLGAIGSAIIAMKLRIRNKQIKFNNKNELEKYLTSLDTQFDNVNEYVQFLSTTIDDFRNFFKPNKEKEKVKITTPIQKALQIVEVSIKNQNIELETRYLIEDKVYIYTNELMQVILNIIKNAEDNFIEKKIKNKKIIISTNMDENDYIITISDNGGGIPDNLLSKIFDPYYSTKQENGTGLGLYMSKIIVEEHNKGSLTTKNIINGIEFKIKLPKLSE